MHHTAQLRSVLARICIAGFLVFLLSLTPSIAFAQGEGLPEAGQAVAAAINQARADAGLPPLAIHPLLNQAAQDHVNDMINNYVYGHYGSDGSNVHTRVARTGYSSSPWVSENWVSSHSVDGAMSWWMNDYIHRVNILNGNWVEMGVGVGSRGGEMIFVTVFSGKTSDGQVAAEPQAPVAEAAQAPAKQPAPQQLTVPPEGMEYTIRPGDTLMGIAFRYGIDWKEIAIANNLGEDSLLQIGQVIRLPGASAAGNAQAASAAPVAPVETTPYTVRAGDTLFSIAARYGVTWQEVAAVNGFGEHSLLQIGQEIKVPKKVVAAQGPQPGTGTGGPIAAEIAQPAAAPPAGPPGVYDVLYTVGEGDTIISIALAHKLDWQALLALNNMTEESILRPGQTLRLR
ncbi:MAG TPA: LysM peptidoglycan-binding domain-containing protein [Caldilineaceae bacterium]|nr:LysM peptidoglycan-binding domain-containing protein [Caldilineaceae bacterium]